MKFQNIAHYTGSLHISIARVIELPYRRLCALLKCWNSASAYFSMAMFQMAYAPVTSMACTFGKIRADEENKEDESVFICIYSAM